MLVLLCMGRTSSESCDRTDIPLAMRNIDCQLLEANSPLGAAPGSLRKSNSISVCCMRHVVEGFAANELLLISRGSFWGRNTHHNICDTTSAETSPRQP